MRRDLEKELVAWKEHSERSPLIVRGARQVGKSYLVENFGRQFFGNSLTVNFEFEPDLKKCFQSLDPIDITNKLQLMTGAEIQIDKTLVFLDEIQECPQAIASLRYFKEKMPGLAVIAAGSLLEFAFAESELNIPVGRVQFLYLGPLSFGEFLDATGNPQLRKHLSVVRLDQVHDDAIHARLVELLRIYLIVGGMPAVVNEYLTNRDMVNPQRTQSALLQTYRSDFGKYSRDSQAKYLRKVFDAAPRMAGQQVKFSRIDPDSRSKDLKNALGMLTMAGLVRPVHATKASGLPLGSQINEQKFKLNFLDVGLMQNICGLQAALSTEKDLLQINAGGVAEQFIGQELIACSDRHEPGNLYYWAREERGSMAEVDYIVNIGADIIPVEVKSGKEGRLRSLRMFMEERNSKIGVRFCLDKPSRNGKILTLPLYMVEQMPRLMLES